MFYSLHLILSKFLFVLLWNQNNFNTLLSTSPIHPQTSGFRDGWQVSDDNGFPCTTIINDLLLTDCNWLIYYLSNTLLSYCISKMIRFQTPAFGVSVRKQSHVTKTKLESAFSFKTSFPKNSALFIKWFIIFLHIQLDDQISFNRLISVLA